MKVFISADIEGISGVVLTDMNGAGRPDYDLGRDLMTGDVNAAVEGALAAGATEIVVRDAHGSAGNLVLAKLHPRAQLIQGWGPVARMMEGVDETFDAALLIGYHARNLTECGTLAHTMTGVVRRLWYNDVELGESGISAAHAGHFGVPVVLVAGDEAMAQEVREVLGPAVHTAIVKYACARQCVRFLPLEESRKRIHDGAEAAVAARASIPPFRPSLPIEVKVRFGAPQQAAAAALVPTVRRLDDLTVAAEVADAVAAANLVCVLYTVAR